MGLGLVQLDTFRITSWFYVKSSSVSCFLGMLRSVSSMKTAFVL
jgi:hypothetical protein